MEADTKENLKDVVVTQEPETQELISGTQKDNPGDVAATQEPATHESDSEM